MPESANKKMEQDAKLASLGKESTESIELRENGEERFRSAVHAAAKSGPIHRQAKR